MTADLPPDVRDRAIFEAREVLFSWIEGRSIDPELAPAIVVAVVAVVAPEIERPLQARITELEATLANARELWDESIAQTSAVVELHGEAHDRVELLTAALTDAIEALGWASDYVAVPWPKAYQVEPLRAALAAGVTESGDK